MTVDSSQRLVTVLELFTILEFSEMKKNWFLGYLVSVLGNSLCFASDFQQHKEEVI